MYKCILTKIRQYIFLILTATIFFTATFSKSLSEENVFIIDSSNFTSIPSGSVSLTVMANALRIGSESSND